MTPEGLEFKLGGESCIMNHAPLLLVQGDCGEAPQVVQHVFRGGSAGVESPSATFYIL